MNELPDRAQTFPFLLKALRGIADQLERNPDDLIDWEMGADQIGKDFDLHSLRLNVKVVKR
jgi:hypothetical protein